MNTSATYKEIEIKIDALVLKGNLRLAEEGKGIVLFAHGSGSSRLSSRNNYVADFLLEKGFSSLLFDLLTAKEDLVYENRFDITLLTQRLVKVTRWVQNYEATTNLPIAYFGASTGAASALAAAVVMGDAIKTIVSRGGRPDLALSILNSVKIPTLLVVGGDDAVVIELNKKAKAMLSGIARLTIVEGASHLFEEPGKLDEVAGLTSDWFDKYLVLN
ncbi:MAG: alpha/beta hydrolase [Flavobacteriaceae bacterium]|nr:alpha/beta hydrolase [Flavobacteriaceae bacterium]